MNIIFLDVDGVLNSVNKLIETHEKTHKSHSGYLYPFDEICLENLQTLVRETNSKLVVTSSWRKDEEGKNILLEMLKKYDLKKDVMGFTPILSNEERSKEIESFLDTLNIKPNFIILDDDSDFGDLLPFLIKTDKNTGLTYENVQEAIKKLNLSKNKKDNDIER